MLPGRLLPTWSMLLLLASGADALQQSGPAPVALVQGEADIANFFDFDDQSGPAVRADATTMTMPLRNIDQSGPAATADATTMTMPLRNIRDHSLRSKPGWKSVHQTFEQVQIFTDGQGYRHRMKNAWDMQYLSNFSIGGQPLVATMDTGSYDLVVFTKACDTCGNGVRYDPRASASHSSPAGAAWKSYDSGSVLTEEAFDMMTVGPYKSVNQSFFEVTTARMPPLTYSDFDAIFGLGPAESRLTLAWRHARNAAEKVAVAMDEEGTSNQTLADEASEALQTAKNVDKYSAALRTINESMFSICLGKEKLSDGYLIWNDTSVSLHPELFHKVPLATNHSWKVEIRNVRFSYLLESEPPKDRHQPNTIDDLDDIVNEDRDKAPRLLQSDEEEEYRVFDNSTSLSMDCDGEAGCRALLDSGSSTLAMPGKVVNAMIKLIDETHTTCDNMLKLPHIVFEMNGMTFSLPPDAYLGSEPYKVSEDSDQATGCSVLVDASVSDSEWILGMPFFRKYYTTFQTGRTGKQRALYFAGSSDRCTPIKSRVLVHDGPPEMWKRKAPAEGFKFTRWWKGMSF